jgi:hypothetical protein
MDDGEDPSLGWSDAKCELVVVLVGINEGKQVTLSCAALLVATTTATPPSVRTPTLL